VISGDIRLLLREFGATGLFSINIGCVICDVFKEGCNIPGSSEKERLGDHFVTARKGGKATLLLFILHKIDILLYHISVEEHKKIQQLDK
jgi:hypothetical protein